MADQIRTPNGITLDRYLDMVRAGAHDAVLEMLRAGEGVNAFFNAMGGNAARYAGIGT